MWAIVLAGCAWLAPSFGQSRDTIEFKIKVIPELARHLELLTAPGYLALAFENNGFYPSVSSRILVKDRESFQVRKGVVRYKGRNGPVYLYEAGVNLELGVVDKAFTVPVEVDTKAVSDGVVAVRAHPPLGGLLPNDLSQRAEFKIASFANIAAQQKLLAYLDRLSAQHSKRGFDGMLEAIVLEAYNKSGGPGPARDRGEPEPLSDQIFLIATVAIWLIGLPILLLFVRIRRKRAGSAPP